MTKYLHFSDGKQIEVKFKSNVIDSFDEGDTFFVEEKYSPLFEKEERISSGEESLTTEEMVELIQFYHKIDSFEKVTLYFTLLFFSSYTKSITDEQMRWNINYDNYNANIKLFERIASLFEILPLYKDFIEFSEIMMVVAHVQRNCHLDRKRGYSPDLDGSQQPAVLPEMHLILRYKTIILSYLREIDINFHFFDKTFSLYHTPMVFLLFDCLAGILGDNDRLSRDIFSFTGEYLHSFDFKETLIVNFDLRDIQNLYFSKFLQGMKEAEVGELIEKFISLNWKLKGKKFLVLKDDESLTDNALIIINLKIKIASPPKEIFESKYTTSNGKEISLTFDEEKSLITINSQQ